MASGFKLDWLGASVAGLVEEPGKLLVLAFIFNNRRYRSILNGLLLGAAVGAGFAAFESAGYAFLYLLQHVSVSMQYNGAVTLRIIVLGLVQEGLEELRASQSAARAGTAAAGTAQLTSPPGVAA